MDFCGEIYRLFVVFLSLCFMLPGADALDTGDALALLLGAILTAVGFCACLGYYARSRERHL